MTRPRFARAAWSVTLCAVVLSSSPSFGAGAGDPLIGGDTAFVLPSDCASSGTVSVTVDATAGGRVEVELRGVDGDGRTVNGSDSPLVVDPVPATGPLTISDRLFLCGNLHSAGPGKVVAIVDVDGTFTTVEGPAVFSYASTVSLARTPRSVARRTEVRLRGVWGRGNGFAGAVGYLNRQQQDVGIEFRPRGSRRWRAVRAVGIDDQGRWTARVRITRTGSWRAVVGPDARNLGATSAVRTITVRR